MLPLFYKTVFRVCCAASFFIVAFKNSIVNIRIELNLNKNIWQICTKSFDDIIYFIMHIHKDDD